MQLHYELQGTVYKFISDPLFLELRNTLDRKMKERSQAGIGTTTRQAESISPEEEEILEEERSWVFQSKAAGKYPSIYDWP